MTRYWIILKTFGLMIKMVCKMLLHTHTHTYCDATINFQPLLSGIDFYILSQIMAPSGDLGFDSCSRCSTSNRT